MRATTPYAYTLLANIGQLLTLAGDSGPRRGSALIEIGLIEDAAVLCGGGKIIAAGKQREVLRDPWLKKNRRKVHEIDCAHGVVIPGFIDSHTHPVYAEPRLLDFEKRIGGASYQEIAAAGGGIRSSVAAVRRASRAQLIEKIRTAFDAMLRQGTTTVEAKSGYGLSTEAEIKSLEAIRSAASRWPGTVVPTLLAAHVVPPEFEGKEDDYVELICEQIIPRVAKQKLASFVDVFCERGAFTLAQSEKIFAAARGHGLGVRAHVCQFTASKLGTLLQHQPASLDHMDCVSPDDISATDFNPGTSPTPSMSFVVSLACTHLKMNPAEAIAATTINAAHALALQARKGSIEPGKDADLAIFDVEDFREIGYWFAWNRCSAVVVGGQVDSAIKKGSKRI